MDKKLIEQLANGELTEEEFRRLLAQSQENVDKLRKQREANRLKSLQLLEQKKNRRNQHDVSKVLLYSAMFCKWLKHYCLFLLFCLSVQR